MTVFLWFIVALYAIAATKALVRLARNNYPRIEHAEPWHDALGLVILIVIALWAYSLLP